MSAAQYRRLGPHNGNERMLVRWDFRFDNSGRGPLRVPGFHGYPVDVERMPDDRFAHGAHDWAQPRLTAREMAMLRVMNQLTDLPGWHVAVLDDDDVAGLRPDPVAAPLMSDLAWSWCVAELRDKAARFRTDQFVSAFDSGSAGIVKSDALISRSLLNKFQTRMAPLIAEVEERQARQASASQHVRETSADRMEIEELVNTIENLSGSGPRISPRPDSPRPGMQLLKLIDPNQYPLVYSKTKVLAAGGLVELEDTLEAVGQGEVAPFNPGAAYEVPNKSWKMASFRRKVNLLGLGQRKQRRIYTRIGYSGCLARSLYSAIEEIISLSIKPWNEVLVRREAYRKPRIRTYGVECQPPCPDWVWDLPELDVKHSLLASYHEGRIPDPGFDDDEFPVRYAEAKEKVARLISIPDPVWEEPLSGLALHISGRTASLHRAMQNKYRSIKTNWQHPEPGVAYTYDDWRAGRADCAVIPPKGFRRDNMAKQPEFGLPVRPVSLQDDFRKEGLQVIVRLASIELEPFTSASVNGVNWLDDGMSNEHIVATTIVCLSSVNLLPYSIFLEVEADLEDSYFHYVAGDLEELGKVFELTRGDRLGGDGTRTPAVQRLGRVYLPEGRLLAVPSVLSRYNDDYLDLADPTKPGHLQMLVLHLVDPNYRICSTRNVPPQQHSWWAAASGLDRVLGQTNGSCRGLPSEVADQIAREVGTWPMGDGEAEDVEMQRVEDEDLYREAVQRGIDYYKFAWD